MAKQSTKVAEDTMVRLDPAVILADDNTRYALDPSRVSTLARDILAHGGVMVPVEVAPLIPPANGHQYRLTSGAYRHAAVTMLNADSTLGPNGAGLTIPAIIHTPSSTLDRLTRQVSENRQRRDQSLMDIAVSIKRLLDEGMDKIAIRTLYARPKTTKEKGTPQPASNAWLNIVHSFLDFPTSIQEAIHNGTLGYDAAYKLSTMPEDKWSVILEKAQADLTAMTIREEKDEEKFIAATKKEEALAAEAKAEEEKLAKVQATVDEAKAAHDEAVRLATEAQAKVAAAKSAKERKELVTVATPILKATGGTLLKLEACTKDLTKLQEAHNKREAARIDREAKAAQAQEARNKKGKATISKAHVEKAAVATGAVDKSAALTLAQVRTLFADLALAGSPEKVRAIANAVTETIMGRMTEKKLFVVLKTATGSK